MIKVKVYEEQIHSGQSFIRAPLYEEIITLYVQF